MNIYKYFLFAILYILTSSTVSIKGYTSNWNFANRAGPISCAIDYDCGEKGSCVSLSSDAMGTKHCVCEFPYINLINGEQKLPCSYKGLGANDMFYISFFLGFFGIDWFILAMGTNPAYIWIGIGKFLSLGGLGLWWINDWVRLWEGNLRDGNGMPLFV
jgi:hypothetical protein